MHIRLDKYVHARVVYKNNKAELSAAFTGGQNRVLSLGPLNSVTS
jgi:hypothetical protein